MRLLLVLAFISSVVSVTSGCAMHNVKFGPAGAVKATPTAQATAIDGQIDEAKQIWEQAKLPHNTTRQRFELECKAGSVLRSQLGSEDYVFLGEVWGGGNGYANLESLKAAFCKKAAAVGGDVIMVYRTGIEDRPYVYSTPGHSTTTVNYSGYDYGSYYSGSGTAQTTYTPGQTFTGTHHLPYGNALVFKYVPGADERRKRIAALSDSQLERVIKETETLAKTSTLSWDEYLRQMDSAINSGGPSAEKAATTARP